MQRSSIRYAWDDWNIERVEDPLDDALLQRLVGLSQRAILAFATGSAEWMVYRFAGLQNDSAPWKFLEAAWAMAIHIRYSGYGKATGWAEFAQAEDDGESVPQRWTGPIRGPISRALTVLESAIQELAWHGREDPAAYAEYAARSACRIHKLTLHVLADSSSYAQWVATVLPLLETTNLVVLGDESGDVVPRVQLDPEGRFDVDQTEALVQAFLAGVDRNNPFLSDAPAMLEPIEDDIEFTGIPYVFNLAIDRAARRNASQGHDHDDHRH